MQKLSVLIVPCFCMMMITQKCIVQNNSLKGLLPGAITFTAKGCAMSTKINRNDCKAFAMMPAEKTGEIVSFYTACNPPCGYGGMALGGIPGTLFLVGSSNIGFGSSVSHEIGHCLGLLHTFEPSNGKEDINGANGNTAADKVVDTPADPYVFSGDTTCYSLSANRCLYTGNCPDPNGASNYSPPFSNLMGHCWNTVTPTCYPNLAATSGQFTCVNSFLGSSSVLINCSSPTSVILYPTTVSSGYYMQSAINTFITNGAVVFNGSSIATIGGGTVYLEPGFHANPSSGGLIDIKIKPCN